MEPQRDISVGEHPNNRLYIDRGAFVHIRFNWELLGGLIELNRVIKIQAIHSLLIFYVQDISFLHS